MLENIKIQDKPFLSDTFFVIFQSQISGVRSQNVEQLKNLLQAIVELVWYLSPHSQKLKNSGVYLLAFFPC